MIRQPEDLRHLRVAAVPDTTSADFLRRFRVSHENISSVPEGFDELARGTLDAVVHDAPVLKYLANTDYVNRVEVLRVIFGRQEYAIALPRDSQLRQPLNEALLQVTRESWWDDLLYRYLGHADR
jgi:ABC-type amino acid transport substrate-binding protein